jgi:hypothetical protein
MEVVWYALLVGPSSERIYLVGAQAQTIVGQPCGGLGCESKCWTWFDSRFDNIHESHRCWQMRVQGEGPKEVSSVH